MTGEKLYLLTEAAELTGATSRPSGNASNGASSMP
jgi:hypothetical protein